MSVLCLALAYFFGCGIEPAFSLVVRHRTVLDSRDDLAQEVEGTIFFQQPVQFHPRLWVERLKPCQDIPAQLYCLFTLIVVCHHSPFGAAGLPRLATISSNIPLTQKPA